MNNLRVLIVDDAQSLRLLLRTLLSQNGYSVVADLEDGSNVIATVQRVNPDIVCLDLHMPKVNGMSVLGELNSQFPDVAVVMMTADTSQKAYREATNLGAAGFLCKPFSPQQILDEMGHVSTAVRMMRSKKDTDSYDASAASTKKAGRVVIADDSVTQRRLLKAILEHLNFEVVGEACDGQQAIDMTQVEKPDVVCLDVEMPIMNGLMALARLHNSNSRLPVIMITSFTDQETVKKALELGAKGYIVKPYQPEKVEQTIRKLLPAVSNERK